MRSEKNFVHSIALNIQSMLQECSSGVHSVEFLALSK